MLEVDEVKLWEEFFETYTYYKNKAILENEKRYLIVDYADIIKLKELADILSEKPEDTLKAGEIVLGALRSNDKPKLDLRIKNFSVIPSNKIHIRDLRSEHLGKILAIEGTIRQISDVRPIITKIKFECPSCGNAINVLQSGTILKEPSQCGCGRRGKFTRLTTGKEDYQRMVIEENIETLEGNQQPKRLNILLKRSLTSKEIDVMNIPGSRVEITGILVDAPKSIMKRGESPEREFLLDANYIKPQEDDYLNMEITQEDEKKILEMSTNKEILNELVGCYAPHIHGHDIIKKAIILFLFGGNTIMMGKRRIKGEIHIMLVGEPAVAKTELLREVGNFSPKFRFTSATKASGVGLTAYIGWDDFLQCYTAEGGVMVLTNNGHVAIDEFDKMNVEERKKMTDALSEGQIPVDKANVHVTFRCWTAALVACNPKYGRFDQFQDLSTQIDMPPELLDRFDSIFPIKDIQDSAEDLIKAKKSLDSRYVPTKIDISHDLIKKYIIYARKNIEPSMSDELRLELSKWYVGIRERKSGQEQHTKTIAITLRQVGAVARYAEASAKARLSKIVTKEDLELGKEIVMHCLTQMALDPETGRIDIDRIELGTSTNTRDRIMTMIKLLETLEKEMKDVPITIFQERAKAELGIDDTKFDNLYRILHTKGDIFEPVGGFVKKV